MKKKFSLYFAYVQSVVWLLPVKSKLINPARYKYSLLVNTSHLDYLYTPVIFSTGTKAAGVYIYSEAPDYHLVADVMKALPVLMM